MAQAPLADELAAQAVAAFKEFGTKEGAARALGLCSKTFRHRLSVAAIRGMMGYEPILPGFEAREITTQKDKNGTRRTTIKQVPERGPVFEMPAGLNVKGVTALVDGQGRLLHQHIMGRRGPADPAAAIEAVKAALKDFKPRAKVSRAPASTEANLLTIVPANDWHIGMFAWGKQTGNNWDLKIAENVLGDTVEDVIARSMSSGECVVLGGGDLLHADNQKNETTGGTPQDVDGRYPKLIQVAIRLKVRTIDAALRRHKRVTVRIIPGNHDEHAAVAIAHALNAWYRLDKRVTVDLDPSPFWWRQFGLCLFGANHGHTVRAAKMPGIMAYRCPEAWGATKFRFVHSFHLHHREKIADENGSVICEIHQAPIPQDSWHSGKGYMSGQSMQAITYHKRLGEYDRVCRSIVGQS